MVNNAFKVKNNLAAFANGDDYCLQCNFTFVRLLAHLLTTNALHCNKLTLVYKNNIFYNYRSGRHYQYSSIDTSFDIHIFVIKDRFGISIIGRDLAHAPSPYCLS